MFSIFFKPFLAAGIGLLAAGFALYAGYGLMSCFLAYLLVGQSAFFFILFGSLLIPAEKMQPVLTGRARRKRAPKKPCGNLPA